MNVVSTPQSRCRAGVSRGDITPPAGIYHRMWGAALHDRATGIHRPLEATVLWMEPLEAAQGRPQVVVALDHCILDTGEQTRIRQATAEATDLTVDRVLVSLSHTHGSGWMSRTRADLPGGELIGPYLDSLAQTIPRLAREAQQSAAPATFVYGIGRCALAAQRDYLDVERGQFVCGFNPTGPADDTLLVARVTNAAGTLLATVVNYACHPTTLAWENTLISPDWVGAMRETIEHSTGCPCLFLQGASGDLGPREGFVGDPAVADRNGRQVGYAVLSTLAGLPPAGTEYRYVGPVLSGATIGVWQHQPLAPATLERQAAWHWEQLTVELPYRHDLPTVEQTTAERDHWLAEETRARTAGDHDRLRQCRAEAERRTRQLARLSSLSAGRTHALTVQLGVLGDALWISLPGEYYQIFQQQLRQRFAPRPVIVATLTNAWQPGYFPAASSYGYGIYQEVISAMAPGCLETLIESLARRIQELPSAPVVTSR
uniref:Neutral/alkaline non-lysosomal ceramidase N-terminal domain-containing protein n=1 Tax=Schlesneria paludicola TaxID=360056 RepID=A0A7C2NX49_9PLAN